MIIPATQGNILLAAQALRRGELVAFPTETVYGLGASIYREDAIERIFRLKDRPSSNPLIVHGHSLTQLDEIAETREAAPLLQVLGRFWPGPLSVVLPKKAGISSLITAGGPGVAFRIPAHEVALSLLKECKVPLAAPSANPSNYVSPTMAQHVQDNFGEASPMILDGGPCRIGLESTVISLMNPARPRLLRPGAVSLEQLREVMDIDPDASEKTGLSPGMLEHHYSPRTPLRFRSDCQLEGLRGRVGLITFRKADRLSRQFSWSAVNVLSEDEDEKEIAHNLFAALRDQDKLGLDLILIDSCDESGMGLAIMDRLRRAAAARS